MSVVAFSCMNFVLFSITQTNSNKQGSTHKNSCYKLLVCILLNSLVAIFLYISGKRIKKLQVLSRDKLTLNDPNLR